jgi:hypothetical protein
LARPTLDDSDLDVSGGSDLRATLTDSIGPRSVTHAFRVADRTSPTHFRNQSHAQQWSQIQYREGRAAGGGVRRVVSAAELREPDNDVGSKKGLTRAWKENMKPRTFYRRMHLAGRIFAEGTPEPEAAAVSGCVV